MNRVPTSFERNSNISLPMKDVLKLPAGSVNSRIATFMENHYPRIHLRIPKSRSDDKIKSRVVAPKELIAENEDQKKK